eukprot:TRINITY_DN8485_c0_g1_i5.p1 TRINITY_DN8485_c0_g1~~TRINITY_DN8485_c0_g1_i5.p1  ORF type:complete len:159 (+),score=11.47 TRINITY_DN8485_c0_g1_i5:61-477(+)
MCIRDSLWDAQYYDPPSYTYDHPTDFVKALHGIVDESCQHIKTEECDDMRTEAQAAAQVLLDAINHKDFPTFNAQYDNGLNKIGSYVGHCVQPRQKSLTTLISFRHISILPSCQLLFLIQSQVVFALFIRRPTEILTL